MQTNRAVEQNKNPWNQSGRTSLKEKPNFPHKCLTSVPPYSGLMSSGNALRASTAPMSYVPVAPELRSGKNYDRWGPRNGLSQFLGAQELSSAAFRPILTTEQRVTFKLLSAVVWIYSLKNHNTHPRSTGLIKRFAFTIFALYCQMT